MKSLYSITRSQFSKERSNAFEGYKRLLAIRGTTAALVQSYKRAGISRGQSQIEIVQSLRSEYKRAIGYGGQTLTIERRLYGRKFTASAGVNDIDALRDAIREIREDIRTYRRRNRNYALDVREEGNYWFFRQQNAAYEGKAPNDDDNYIGIELECLVPCDNNLKIELLPWRKYLSIAGDGSISCDEENAEIRDDGGDDDYYEGKEFRILVKESLLSEVVENVTRVLVKAGAIVNKSCGLHVHFDMRQTTHEQRETIYSKLYHALPLLKKIVPKSRRDNTYCKLNSENKPSYSGNRYKAINPTAYRKHRTFEIRLFNGTLDAVKILSWIAVLFGIMRGANVLRCPHTFKTAAKSWGISPELVAWCEARAAKFAPRPQVLHSGTVIDGNEGRDDSANPPAETVAGASELAGVGLGSIQGGN